MKRFSSLEFGDAERPDRDTSHGEPMRDEAYFHEQALRSYLAGDFELALRNFSRALERNTSFFDGWTGQLHMLIELGEYPEALVWADKALEFFPEHPDLIAAKAVACIRDARFDKALAYSDNAVSRERTTAWVWLARAEVLMKRKPKIAENCMSKALAVAGNRVDLIRLEVGRIFRRYSRYSAGLEHLETSVRDFPKSALAWYELGCCQLGLGFGQAVTSLEQCLQIRPDWRPAVEALGRARKRGLGRIWRRIRGR